MNFDGFKDLDEYRESILELGRVLNVEMLQEEVRQGEAESQEGSFWEDQARAQRILQELNRKKATVAKFEGLQAAVGDVEVCLELLRESPEAASLVDEAESLMAGIRRDVDEMEIQTLLSGKFDSANCVFSIFAGAGGTDAQDWAGILYRMYARYFDSKGFSYELVDESVGDEAGIKSATMIVTGDFAYGLLKEEAGVHRLVRISPFNANGKRQTSFAAVDVIPEVSADFSDIVIPSEELRVDTYRASGAGGQHVNKTDSAVRITHIPTGTVAQSQASRSQTGNRETAMSLLKSRLVLLMESQHKETLSEIRGESMKNEWGSQIRSYVFHPYQMVKDHRTEVETSQLQKVLDGDLEAFVRGSLRSGKGAIIGI